MEAPKSLSEYLLRITNSIWRRDCNVLNYFILFLVAGITTTTIPTTPTTTNDPLKFTCCSDIEVTGFTFKFINGLYYSAIDVINGRHVYVKENKAYGIWLNGESGDAANWVLGLMMELAVGKVNVGFARSTQYSSCISSTKVWNEWWDGEWVHAETGIMKCLSGYY